MLLAMALRNTFDKRNTVLTGTPAILSPDFVRLDSKQLQWQAFIRKSNLHNVPKDFTDITASILHFITPVVESILCNNNHNWQWTPPGPWQKSN